MPHICDYCRGPITASPLCGRPRADGSAASYCCYGCLSIGETNPVTKRKTLDGFTIRLGIGLLIAGQSMIFGLAINLEEQTPRMVKLGVQGVILTGTLLTIALLGGPLFRSAWSELRRGRLTIEALFLLTMTGAMAASMQSFISGEGPIYFEVVTVLLVVYSIGKTIGARSRAAALASAGQWSSALQTCRLVNSHGDDRLVDVATVRPGDVVEVRAGELIAIDGAIREGVGFVSEAPVSGEPFVVIKRPGDRVLAGVVSYDAVLHIEATAAGSVRQIDRLLEAVEAARSQPTSVQAQADRLSRIFVPLIVGAALATFAAWTYFSGWQTGLFNSMSVLLVACPCALGLATPIVLWSALNRLAERGFIAHRGDVVERLAQVDRVVFDKTGTLTEEQFAIVDIATHAEGEERARILGWLSLIEAQSSHPIARPFALLRRAFSAGEAPRILSHRTVPGYGVEAELEDGGTVHRIRIGRPDWLCSPHGEEAALLGRLITKDGHRIDCEIDGRLSAIALVTERLRESTPEALAALQNLGLPVRVLTGDTTRRAVALGLNNVEGDLLPEDKRQRIEQIGGRALMIGDGINDASALAAAHVGIALASGADFANCSAMATLHHNDLRTIPWAIAFSRQAMRTVRRNLWRAAAYNVVGISLAAFGVLHPVAAALLMVVSSLWVAWSSVRVGSNVEWCSCEPPSPTVPSTERLFAMIRACAHGLAFAGQAVIAALLLHLSSSSLAVTIAAFVGIGVITSWWWFRARNVPHWLDMAYGMVTVGNLGMLFGWWADNGFARLHDAGCCACVQAMREGLFKPWMWIGMLVGANAAMLFLARRPDAETLACRAAMLTGGNLGMVAGMIAGAWGAAQIEMTSIPLAALVGYLGMTLGMIAGMLLGAAGIRLVISYFQILRNDQSYVALSNAIEDEAVT